MPLPKSSFYSGSLLMKPCLQMTYDIKEVLRHLRVASGVLVVWGISFMFYVIAHMQERFGIAVV